MRAAATAAAGKVGLLGSHEGAHIDVGGVELGFFDCLDDRAGADDQDDGQDGAVDEGGGADGPGVGLDRHAVGDREWAWK